jgi:hypothetical protein
VYVPFPSHQTHYLTRSGFYINLPVGGLAALLIIFAKIRTNVEKPPVTLNLLRNLLPKLDLFGFLLFTPAAITFLMALQFGSGSEYEWDSGEVIGLFCCAGAMALLFLAWEWHKGMAAMIPLPVVTMRRIWTSSLNYGFVMSATIAASSFMPIYFQSVRNLSPTMSGVYMLGSILPQIVFVVASGAISKSMMSRFWANSC